VFATTYNGSGAGLTSIPIGSISGGSANRVITTNSSGNIAQVAQLPVGLGGTGQNFSAVVGPNIITVTSGVATADLGYSTNVVENSLVQRDTVGGLTGQYGNFLQNVSTPSIISDGNISFSAAGGTVGLQNADLRYRDITAGTLVRTRQMTTTDNKPAGLIGFPMSNKSANIVALIQVYFIYANSVGDSASFSMCIRANNNNGRIVLSSPNNVIYMTDEAVRGASIEFTTGTYEEQDSVIFQAVGLPETSIFWTAYGFSVTRQYSG